jgi:hypothetical protein
MPIGEVIGIVAPPGSGVEGERSMRMRASGFAIIVLAGALAACTSTQEVAQKHCDGYGFTRGTPEYARCVQTEANAMRERADQDLATGAALLAPRRPGPVVNTQCVNSGIFTNCQTW